MIFDRQIESLFHCIILADPCHSHTEAFYLMNRCLSCGELLQGFFVHKEFTEKLALAIDKC